VPSIDESQRIRLLGASAIILASPYIDPYQSGFPVEFGRKRQGYAVFVKVGRVLLPVDVDLHALM
jgi:hypothetical protein